MDSHELEMVSAAVATTTTTTRRLFGRGGERSAILSVLEERRPIIPRRLQ
jgi:hypothetical protein